MPGDLLERLIPGLHSNLVKGRKGSAVCFTKPFTKFTKKFSDDNSLSCPLPSKNYWVSSNNGQSLLNELTNKGMNQNLFLPDPSKREKKIEHSSYFPESDKAIWHVPSQLSTEITSHPFLFICFFNCTILHLQIALEFSFSLMATQSLDNFRSTIFKMSKILMY